MNVLDSATSSVTVPHPDHAASRPGRWVACRRPGRPTLAPARPSAWPASRDAASRRSPAPCCACCPKARVVGGRVLLNGDDVYDMKPGRLRAVRWTAAAIVFQGALHSLNPVRRVGRADRGGDAAARRPRERAGAETRRVGELLDRVGLPAERARAYPHQMSGGQRQRVLIAWRWPANPTLLIADEPTTALDVMVQAQVLDLLAELQRDRGLALLFITHDLSVLSRHVRTSRRDVCRSDRRGGPERLAVRRCPSTPTPGAGRRVPDHRRPVVADAPERSGR